MWRINKSCQRERIIWYELQCEKTYLLTCAPNEDSKHTAHARSLIRVFVVRKKKLCITVCQKCAQWRFWSDYVNAQADLTLSLAHTYEGTISDVAVHPHMNFPIISDSADFSFKLLYKVMKCGRDTPEFWINEAFRFSVRCEYCKTSETV